MTEEYWQNLGRRAVACKAWRWMRGMAADDGCSVARESDLEGESHLWFDGLEVWCDGDLRLPDLRDPATLGCLLALVREAWKNPTIAATSRHNANGVLEWFIVMMLDPSGERAVAGQRLIMKTFGSEAETLVSALEAAP